MKPWHEGFRHPLDPGRCTPPRRIASCDHQQDRKSQRDASRSASAVKSLKRIRQRPAGSPCDLSRQA